MAHIVESCDAIAAAVSGSDVAAYLSNRLVRSAVEREFLIIGEAIVALGRLEPELASQITHARLIVGVRNRLAHAYSVIDDEAVLRIAQRDVSVLRDECRRLLGGALSGSPG